MGPFFKLHSHFHSGFKGIIEHITIEPLIVKYSEDVLFKKYKMESIIGLKIIFIHTGFQFFI